MDLRFGLALADKADDPDAFVYVAAYSLPNVLTAKAEAAVKERPSERERTRGRTTHFSLASPLPLGASV